MATPKYDALIELVKLWGNRDSEILATGELDKMIGKFLGYAADDAYRLLRIPPLVQVYDYEITEEEVVKAGEVLPSGVGPKSVTYLKMPVPVDLTEVKYIRVFDSGGNPIGISLDERVDERSFFNAQSNTYTENYWMRSGDYLYLRPVLGAGMIVSVTYYRSLPALNALYDVVPLNYELNLETQPSLLVASGATTGTALYVVKEGTKEIAVYATNAEATAAKTSTQTVVEKFFTGKEVENWLRDQNERTLVWGALQHFGSFLDDDKMEARYEKKFLTQIGLLNSEEAKRIATGGTVQAHYQSGLI